MRLAQLHQARITPPREKGWHRQPRGFLGSSSFCPSSRELGAGFGWLLFISLVYFLDSCSFFSSFFRNSRQIPAPLQEPGLVPAAEMRARDAKAVVVVDPFSSGALLAKRYVYC